MKYITSLIVLFAMVTFSSCADDKKKSEPEIVTVDHGTTKEGHKAGETEAEFNDPKVGEVYERYIEVKTSLVNTNSEDASEAASNLMTAFANIGVEEEVLLATQNLKESGGDVEKQRAAFETVTEHVEKMLHGALKSGTIYKQFCPMAFNNKGAYWLSNSKDIYNPYFGDAMLRCGRVDSEIK